MTLEQTEYQHWMEEYAKRSPNDQGHYLVQERLGEMRYTRRFAHGGFPTAKDWWAAFDKQMELEVRQEAVKAARAKAEKASSDRLSAVAGPLGGTLGLPCAVMGALVGGVLGFFSGLVLGFAVGWAIGWFLVAVYEIVAVPSLPPMPPSSSPNTPAD